MLLLLFRRSYCRVPTRTPTKPVATAGRAYGHWYKRNHSFVFRLSPGVCKASATFTSTSGIYEFQFRSGFCQAVHIPWEDMDYDYNHDYYLLARERDRLGMGDFMISDRPFQRWPRVTDFYNPTRPAYLVRGAVSWGQWRYDQDEYQSPDNRYYQPRHENDDGPQDRRQNLRRRWSCSRSRRNCSPLWNQPPPPASPSPEFPPPPYTSSVSKQSPPVEQGIPPMVRSKSRDLPSILVSNDPQWKIRFKKVPDLHKRFLMEVCGLIVNTAELAQFAKGCGISDYIISRAALDNMGNDGECIEQALCRWWMSSNMHPRRRSHKIKLGFDQLDCPGLFGTLLDRYSDLDPRADEAMSMDDPIPGPSTDPKYDMENGETLGVSSQLWKEESFRDAEKTLNRGITTLLMNLATLVSNMDDISTLADSMRVPRQVATQLVSIYKPVMVTVLQMYMLCSYHMLVVWYWSETGDEFGMLYNLQKIFDYMGLGSRCADIMSCHEYGPIDTGLKGLLKPENLSKKGTHNPPMRGGLNRLNELQENLETSPSDTCSSSGKNGENTIDGEVSINNLNPGFKIDKNVSFEDSMVAGLRVKVLEKDTDGTIRRVNVTHSESE